MWPEPQRASTTKSTNGSLTGLLPLRRNTLRPSGRRCSFICTWLAMAVYSMPWARKISAAAVLACSESASAAVICGRSISARSGSPKADCTVMGPKASAAALGAYKPTDRAAAVASAEYFQRCMDAINGEGLKARESSLFLFFMVCACAAPAGENR